MTPRDLPAKRLAVLEETAHGTEPVAVYGGDLRALLAMRRLLLAAPLAVDLVIDLPTLTNAGGILFLVLVVFAVMLYQLYRSRR